MQDKRAGRVDHGHLLELAFAAAATRQNSSSLSFLPQAQLAAVGSDTRGFAAAAPRPRCCFLGGAMCDCFLQLQLNWILCQGLGLIAAGVSAKRRGNMLEFLPGPNRT